MAVDFAAIRRDYPLEQVVGATLKLRKSGANKLAVCPFHADRSPSLVLYPDNTYHCYGCSAHGDVIDYVSKTQNVSTSDAIRHLTGGSAPVMDEADQRRRDAERKTRDAEHRRKQENDILAARGRWARALSINGTGSEYLFRKNVAPYGCRREGDNLLVPIFDADGIILSVQSIAPDGAKMFHAGAPMGGGHMYLGKATEGPIVIVEGFATGGSVQAATGLLVVVAFSKNNLLSVAETVAARYPDRSIIIGADSNGVDKAQQAADAIGATVVLPDLQGADGTDFNDQAEHYGLEDVAALFTARDEAGLPKDRAVKATAFSWRPTEQIAKRQWLYGRHLLRKFVSLDVAAGGVGKSSLKIGEALAMASGQDFYSKGLPEGALNVWMWNLEDPHDEIERRIHATAQRFKLKPEDLGNRLYVDSGRDQPLVMATEGPNGAMIVRPVVDALIEEMIARKIDVLQIDPFVSSHAVSENDNNAIDIVAREWNIVAERTGAAINLVHHVRKQNGTEATADSARGASSLIGKARSVLVYNRMSEDEAAKLNVPAEERFFYFRVDNDKANLAPPERGDWYRMNNEDLANGDSVGVACAWTPPDAFDGLTARHLYMVQKAVSEGEWRENVQTKDQWVGNAVAAALGLDLDDKHNRKRVQMLLYAWVREGALEVVEVEDRQRRPRKHVVVGKWVQM